ncbi:MAG: VanW family protein [Lachnospiraceae bacterium]|nr:VanW family protein [Lachnospiraceae bacterium]
MKKFLLPIMVFALCAIGVTGMDSVFASETSEDTIPSTVYIENVDVSGMTEEQAYDAIDGIVESLSQTEITLATSAGSVTVTAGDLGLTVADTDVVKEALTLGKSGSLLTRYLAKKDLENSPKYYELCFTLNENLITTAISENEESLTTEAIDSTLKREDGVFTVVEGQNGVAVNYSESVAAVIDYIENGWSKTSGSVTLSETVEEPQGTAEELSKVKDLLGSYSTDFSSSAAGRYKNVQNGAEKINGTVIYPGDQFSVYETVSPFDAENGYELAGSYENGTTVQTYGGGICQVSTTLYNAVIRAELQVDERHEHSMIVSYVKPSADAAIAGTYKDMKFTNNTDAPIYIEGYTSGGIIYFNIYGEETRDENRVVSFESVTTSQTDAGVTFQATADAVGYVATTQSAHTGYTAELYKVVTVDGEEVSRELFNSSTYRASNKIISVGTATADPTAAAQIAAAIATNDEGTIRAVAASLAAGDTASAQGSIDAAAAAAAAAAEAAAAQAAADAAAAAQTTPAENQ